MFQSRFYLLFRGFPKWKLFFKALNIINKSVEKYAACVAFILYKNEQI